MEWNRHKDIDASFFRLDPAGEGTLTDQLASRLRDGIRRGFWKRGETLPDIRSLARLCGTSERVPRAAFARLQDENLVKARPRLGAIVLPDYRRVWRGRVLLVEVGARESYYHAAFYGVLVERLVCARFRVERAWVSPHVRNASDLGDLRRSLAEPCDLVIVTNFVPTVVQTVCRAGLPCFLIGRAPAKMEKNVIGFTEFDFDSELRAFARHCRAAHVARALEVNFAGNVLTATTALKAAGVAVERIDIRMVEGGRRLEGFLRGGLDALAARLRRPLPDLVFLADDYLALGALQSISAAGVRAPQDVKLAVFSNYGFGPVYPLELTRIEANAYEDGALVAERLIGYLVRGVPPGRIPCARRFLRGQTL